MKKIIIITLLVVVNSAYATKHHVVKRRKTVDNTMVKSVNLYKQKNVLQLEKLSQQTKSQTALFYLGQLYLEKNQITKANQIANQLPDNSYMKAAIQHGLMSYYFNNNEWSRYLNLYNEIPKNQITNNEACGYDLATMSTNANQTLQNDLKHYANNSTPHWCIETIHAAYIAHKLDNNTVSIMLYNLIANDQTKTFNQVASKFNISSQNFEVIGNESVLNKYKFVYKISKQANKDPIGALYQLNNHKNELDNVTRQYINNYLMVRLASKQYFSEALSTLSEINPNYFSDDMFEWRNRTFLYFQKWPELISSINSSPKQLQDKAVWQYWLAYAYTQQGYKNKAIDIVRSIKQDYSYYPLLAYSQYFGQVSFPRNIIATKSIDSLKSSADTQLALNTYLTAIQYNNQTLRSLATEEWHYAVAKSDDADLVLMSTLAKKVNWFDMSIYAASKINQTSMELSYPLLFDEEYKKYSILYGVDNSYPLAITRQESRFNKYALAFDGGVGLMQIMPGTARYIAKTADSSNCYKNYSCNIKFGTWYLGSLSRKFGNNLIYATVAYNAGPNRAHTWQVSFSALPEPIQIELIPFTITRNYVKQVLTNKSVYDSQISESTSVNLYNYINHFSNNHGVFIPDQDNTDAYKLL